MTMLGVPRQIKGPKPWPLHPWMVSFYDGKWHCHVGIIRDEDYVPVENERTFAYYVQNVRQNMIQYQRGNLSNDKGGSNNPKPHLLGNPAWTCGNKIYRKKLTSSEGMGKPSSISQSEEIATDGRVSWPSGAFHATQFTWIVLRKITFSGETLGKWHVLALPESEVWEDDDICVAQIEPSSGSPSGWMVAQVLKSDVLGMGGQVAEMYPFKVEAVSGQHAVNVYTGTVLNVLPTYPDGKALHGSPSGVEIGSLSVPSSGSFSVYLEVTSDQTTFPVSVMVKANATMPSETLDVAYLRIVDGYSSSTNGTPRVSLGNPYIKTSIWGDRMRLPNYSSNSFWRV